VPSQSHLGLSLPEAWHTVKKDAVCGHGTISVDAEPFHVIHMGLADDLVTQNSLLVWPICAKPIPFWA
jgi:hypothetical protein